MDFIELFNATKNNDIKIVKSFLKNSNYDVAQKDNQIFIIACFNGHINIVKLLLEDKRIDPNARNSAGLLNAFNLENNELIEVLINHPRVNFSNNNKIINSVLLLACKNADYFKIDKILSNYKFNIDENKNFIINLCEYSSVKPEKDFIKSLNLLLTDGRFTNLNIIHQSIRLLIYNNSNSGIEVFFNYNTFNNSFNDSFINNSFNNNEILKNSISDNKLESFKIFYKFLSHKHYFWNISFNESIRSNQKNILEFLLNNNNNNNFLKYYIFIKPFYNEDIDMIKILLKNEQFSFIKEDISFFSKMKNNTINESEMAIYLSKYKQLHGAIKKYYLKELNMNAEDLINKEFSKYIINSF
jgi:hypothetical protein